MLVHPLVLRAFFKEMKGGKRMVVKEYNQKSWQIKIFYKIVVLSKISQNPWRVSIEELGIQSIGREPRLFL